MKKLNTLKMNVTYKLHLIFKKQDLIMVTVGSCMALSGYVDPRGFWEIYNFITELEIRLNYKENESIYSILYQGYKLTNLYTTEHNLNIKLVSETIIKLCLLVYKHRC